MLGLTGKAGSRFEERGIYAALWSKFIEGTVKLESFWLFHVEAT